MPIANAERQEATSQILRYGLLLLCVAAAFALALKVLHWHSRSQSIPQIHAIVVLPLRNAGGDRDQYLADGITEKLISDLGRISAVPVISRTSAMSLRQTNRSIPEIARQLGVDGVVDGFVLRDGNQIRINAQLSDGNTGRQLWKREYFRSVSSTLQLASDIAHDIAAQIRIGVKAREQTGSAPAHQPDAEAQDLYLQGKYFLNRGDDYLESIDYFQKAIEKDPSFAPAYAGLAADYNGLGRGGSLPYTEAYSKAKIAAKKATELDKDSAEGHAALAEALVSLDWDWRAAGDEFHRALEANPSSASAHLVYARYLTKLGRSQEAISEAETGRKLDPLSLLAYHEVAYCYYADRRYERALETIREAAELNLMSPSNVLHWVLGAIYVEKGNYQKAFGEFRVARDWGHIGNAYARAGQIEEANQMIARLKAHVKERGTGTYEIALVYAGLGNKDEAFVWLEKAYQVRDKGLTFLKIDPCVDPLRSDPRFQNLLRRVGLAD